MKTLLLVVNSPKFFLSHWLGIAKESQKEGFDVHVLTTNEEEHIEKIKDLNFNVHIMPLSRSGVNFISEMKLFFTLMKMFSRIRPDVVHLITIKPVIYGGIAARLCGVPNIVAAVTGLGYVFLNTSKSAILLRSIVKLLYKFSLSNPNVSIVFENKEDKLTFVQQGLVKDEKSFIIDGAGVELSEYPYLPEPSLPIKVIFASRLLRDKGVFEFLDAIEICTNEKMNIEFIIAGDIDPGNPASLTESDCQSIGKANNVRYLGYRNDIAHLFANSHIVVLPSYREGLPKVLIEAAACGRATITTDVPGCRNVILPNVTGLLVRVKNSEDLAAAIMKMSTNTSMRVNFGRAARQLAEEKYSINTIYRMYLSLYRKS